MSILDSGNRALGKLLIKRFDDIGDRKVRIQYGLLAGYLSIATNIILFIVKIVLGLIAGSISIVADAFHLLSHLANSIVLVVSFLIALRPATAKTPFGYGRMEHVAPFIMSIFLFVTGIQIAEQSLHVILDPHPIHYWSTLPWILLATVIVKEVVGQFVRFLGHRVHSDAILANAFHHRIEALISLTVIAGLIGEAYLHTPEIDGIIGILVALWLFYLGYRHGRTAIIPLLGKAPSQEMIQQIRRLAKSVEGVADVHEIIVHDYGSLYIISLHAEIPVTFSREQMHEIVERCEAKLRSKYRGEVVCHTDPLLKKTKKIMAIEDQFQNIIKAIPQIVNYHDFRVVAESPQRIIIVADIDVADDVLEEDFKIITKNLETSVAESIPRIAYSRFYVTPKFSY